MRLPSVSANVSTSALLYEAQSQISSSIFYSGQVIQPSDGGGVPAPKPGCWFVGTECRVGIQNCKYCCGGGQSYTQQCGWCVGWYDAPPCTGPTW